MTDTATPETGPVDAPASAESIAAEILAGQEAPDDTLEGVTQELVNEAEGQPGDSEQEPGTEGDATDPAEEAEEPGEKATQEEATYTVKVNGEELQVPLSELLNGYSRTTDYKQKTAEVAEQRRQIEAQRATVETDVKAAYATKLEEATNLFAQFDPVLTEARNVDWDALKATDPAAFVAAQDAVQARLATVQRMQQEVAKARGEAEQAQQQRAEQERAQRFDKAADAIVKAMPELADEAKFQAFANEAVSFLRNEGFTGDEIMDSLDERVLRLANDARRWRAHEAAQKSLSEKRVVPKSAVKPLTTDGTGSRATQSRFPANASRDRKGDWIADQILSEA